MTCGTYWCNTAFTRVLQQSLFWAESTKFLVLIPIYLKSILILSSHLCLDLPKGLFSGFTCLNFESTPTFLHSGYMTCSCESSRLNYSDHIRWTVQSIKSLIVEISPLPIHISMQIKNKKNSDNHEHSTIKSIKVRLGQVHTNPNGNNPVWHFSTHFRKLVTK